VLFVEIAHRGPSQTGAGARHPLHLWRDEHVEGREEGTKDRPCAIVAAVISTEDGATRVLVLPITHAEPDNPSMAVEIPAGVKRQLRLDRDRSWVVVSEWNEFQWPGPDLRRVGRNADASVAYGFLPRGFFKTVRDRFVAAIEAGRAAQVRRTE
jgi:hypothetical protein